MVARVAMLRYMFAKCQTSSGKAGRDYWERVDDKLTSIWASKDNDEKRISAVFSKYLKDDRNKYGKADSVDNLLNEPVNIDRMVDAQEAADGL